MTVKNLLTLFRSRPLNVILWKIKARLTRQTIPELAQWLEFTENKNGVEIGGPSGLFSKNNYLPVYPGLKNLDGVNFSNNTIWEGSLQEGYNYDFDGKKGFQFIAEATNLNCIADETYDVVLSSNNLEHIANPLKALYEWKRIIKRHGCIVCVLPRKESNFDHKRAITDVDHLINDFNNNVDESDLTHLKEILSKHDLNRDPLAGSKTAFKERCEQNITFRSSHHHVFDISLLKAIMENVGLTPILTHSSPMDHFILAVKD